MQVVIAGVRAVPVPALSLSPALSSHLHTPALKPPRPSPFWFRGVARFREAE